MGIQSDGMFGGFYGKTGPLIGRRVRGRSLVTALYHPSTQPSTVGQLKEQNRFTMLTQFFLKIRTLVAIGFGAYAKRGNALNAAYKFNYPQAFVIDGPEAADVPLGELGFEQSFQLNFPALVYSRGRVATPNCPSIALSSAEVKFTWLPEKQSLYNQNTDLATFVVYNATRQRFVFMQHAATRAALSYTMPLAGTSSGDRVFCYMNFASASSKLTGDSVCVGGGGELP